MLAMAMTAGKPVASDPVPLLRADGPIGWFLPRRSCRTAMLRRRAL